MSGHANHPSPARWTRQEDRLLGQMRKEGMSWEAIAQALWRSVDSVKKRHGMKHGRRTRRATTD